jgi:Uma2 family endonuclease
MLFLDPHRCYPSAEELPHSDDTPVDNELQDLIPGMLKAMLALVWADRQDWFFGVDMGVYYDPDEPAIVPDGFLSLGVERVFDEGLRLSYTFWEEGVAPTIVLEVVSHNYRGEYSKKKEFYASLQIPYYVVYNPLRRRAAKLEVHEWRSGEYHLLESISTEVPPSERVWIDRIGLAIGRERGVYMGIEREWLYWYREDGTRVLSAEEALSRTQISLNRAEKSNAKLSDENAKLAQKLRELGIDPETL